ncbi:Lecithin-cholesterol acyltransferase-like 4 [Rhynchospora pubera]|uniref:Lecithin-cholesterol acyltransferase-like 4 n=1 Tax=Rhynchospora pubera TaxID=906938 RepID=A0AAV8CT73_9POAL|nr:Lecithin-cholesterol acyltransferase-like 4 [Rhynchospora pubera]
MALLEELIRAIELWLRIVKKQEYVVNPNLDPVLLVPGIAGSILHAVDEEGKKAERVWIRILGADHEFRTKLWSRFDPSTGKSVSLDDQTRIVVPEDRYGLYAIDTLDPDMIVGSDCVGYYHDMIAEMIKWGYQEGSTLFGFGYDFRQSNRLKETMEKFQEKLETAYNSAGKRKLTVITHSMGGLLLKCFMSLHNDIFEKYVKRWIAIAAPFQGAPGYITTSLLNGMSFVEGWEANFFISKWSMQQLLIECPSIYELMASPDFNWHDIPVLQMWRQRVDNSGQSSSLLESYGPKEAISLMAQALCNHKVSCGGTQLAFPLNNDILKWAEETREIISRAKLPDSVEFYNIYGIDVDTAHSVCYGSELAPVSDVEQIIFTQPQFIFVTGDGSVPAESAKADGFNAISRVGVLADHRGIVCDRHVFRIVKHWLKAGEPDPFYDPVNDYVILPTAFEVERHREDKKEITSVKEEWEIVSSEKNTKCNYTEKSSAIPSFVGSVSVTCEGDDEPSEEAEALLVVEPNINGKQHVVLRATGIAMDK